MGNFFDCYYMSKLSYFADGVLKKFTKPNYRHTRDPSQMTTVHAQCDEPAGGKGYT